MNELLEADFAQIEHVNQIIYNNMNHVSWSCFDTQYLIREHKKLLERLYSDAQTVSSLCVGTYDESNPKNSKITKNITNVRYNSSLVSITKLSNGYRYDFEVRNALWDGGYVVTKSKNSSDDADEKFSSSNIIVTKDNTNGNKISFTITGTDSDRVRICFKMNIQADGRNIQTTSVSINNPTEYEHQFDKQVCEYGYIYAANKTPIEGVTVKIEPVDSTGKSITGGIKAFSAVTDKDGKFKMCYSAVNVPGDYYVLMKVAEGSGYDSATSSLLIHIKKIQKQTLRIDWGDENQYKNVLKGSIKTYEIKIGLNNEFGVHDATLDKKLSGMTVNVTWIGFGDKRHTQTAKITTNSSGEYVINPRCSYRNYYFDDSKLEVQIPLSAYGTKTATRIVRHSWFVAEDYTQLANQCTNLDGTDWIFLKPKTYTATKTITINREITIAGLKGNTHCEIDGSNKSIFETNYSGADTDNYMNVNLVGIKLKNAESAIKLTTGCRLLIDRCYFTNNKHESKHHRGCSIYMPVTDKNLKENKKWKTEVRNSYFYNNRGNEIQSIGTTSIHHSLFKTDSSNYLQQPEVKVVSVRAGSVTYKHNKSHILIPFKDRYTAMSKNHSFAKALAYVDTGAKFNGKGPSNLKGDMKLPLYGNPWYNEAYTYCCYYYPYENVRTWIVCSPRVGYERKATGHASSARRWVFYDGYDFIRLSQGLGNQRHPWTDAELSIPANLGIYDLEKNKFEDDYDPRYSNNKSKTSEV